jgi:hypothetical protein
VNLLLLGYLVDRYQQVPKDLEEFAVLFFKKESLIYSEDGSKSSKMQATTWHTSIFTTTTAPNSMLHSIPLLMD